jgi:hypothetical protein
MSPTLKHHYNTTLIPHWYHTNITLSSPLRLANDKFYKMVCTVGGSRIYRNRLHTKIHATTIIKFPLRAQSVNCYQVMQYYTYLSILKVADEYGIGVRTIVGAHCTMTIILKLYNTNNVQFNDQTLKKVGKIIMMFF